VVLWSIQDHISTLSCSDAVDTPKDEEKDKEKVSDSPKIAARGLFEGHNDTVEDVQFCPSR
jgi:histone-binding protein RBBP4